MLSFRVFTVDRSRSLPPQQLQSFDFTLHNMGTWCCTFLVFSNGVSRSVSQELNNLSSPGRCCLYGVLLLMVFNVMNCQVLNQKRNSHLLWVLYNQENMNSMFNSIILTANYFFKLELPVKMSLRWAFICSLLNISVVQNISSWFSHSVLYQNAFLLMGLPNKHNK